jgi:transposase
MDIYGRNLTVIVTDNPKLRKSQLVGIEKNIAKCQKALSDLKYRLQLRDKCKIVKGIKPTFDSVSKNIKDILSADYMKRIFNCEIYLHKDNYNITFSLDNKKYKEVKEKCLGKTILVTNRDNWSNEKIVSTYRSQFHVEEAFKRIKN